MYFTVFWEIPVFGSSTHWVNDSAMEIWFMVVSRKGGDHRYIYIYMKVTQNGGNPQFIQN